jgi:type 1 fimbriae regulatory protein FimE
MTLLESCFRSQISFDAREEITDSSLVAFHLQGISMENIASGEAAPTTVNSSVRTREYLTGAEIERLMLTARTSSRYGHRDATMILIGYRHGLRASELCDLQWSQVELGTGRLHVRRTKNGSASVHPLQGDEICALRRLQREQGASSHVFMTERQGPMTPKAFHALFSRIGARAEIPFPVHPHMLRHGCGYALANAGHDTRAASVSRPQEYPAHGALYRAGAEPVQGLLAIALSERSPAEVWRGSSLCLGVQRGFIHPPARGECCRPIRAVSGHKSFGT